jgi:hypothetical protein
MSDDQKETDVFAGLVGIEVSFERFDLGDGVSISQAHAHLVNPFLVAFASSQEEGFPSKLLGSGEKVGVDLTAELCVPGKFPIGKWNNPINVVRWILAMLRLWASPNISAPVISDISLAKAKESGDNEGRLMPFETAPRVLKIEEPAGRKVDTKCLEWIKSNWRYAAALRKEHKELHLAIEALDQVQFMRDPSLALVSLWGALENIFSPTKTELRFRLSALVASYLEAPGPKRLELQRHVARLYDARTTPSNGGADDDPETLKDTFELLRRVIISIIDRRHVPSKEELEANLFGVTET